MTGLTLRCLLLSVTGAIIVSGLQSFIGCQGKTRRDDDLAAAICARDSSRLFATFDKHTILRRGPLVYLSIRCDGYMNSFVFQSKGTPEYPSLELIRDTIRCPVLPEMRDPMVSAEAYVIKYAQSILQYMDSSRVREVTSEFMAQGIQLKIYMTDQSELYYISNADSLNANWQKSLATMDKIDGHWYATHRTK
jgi:hypothetical protein